MKLSIIIDVFTDFVLFYFRGERLSFGHHYLRPHETFHEPSRKFFPNEVVKIPLYETVPLDLIMGQCYVLDLNTYCKGRPVNSDPEHMYICELRFLYIFFCLNFFYLF